MMIRLSWRSFAIGDDVLNHVNELVRCLALRDNAIRGRQIEASSEISPPCRGCMRPFGLWRVFRARAKSHHPSAQPLSFRLACAGTELEIREPASC